MSWEVDWYTIMENDGQLVYWEKGEDLNSCKGDFSHACVEAYLERRISLRTAQE